VFAWILCFYAIYKGIQMAGKVNTPLQWVPFDLNPFLLYQMIYVTALFPYFCLIILFIRGITLEGAFYGLSYYFKPDMTKLLDPMVWNDASTQIFYSFGLGIGAWMALSSYNEFDNNVMRDTIIIALINGFTAVFSGATVFCIIGYLATKEGKPIEQVVQKGSGLIFTVYPSATLEMPYANLWTVLFFMMMLMLGLGSQFIQLESFFTGMIDEYPRMLGKGRTLFIAYVMFISAIIGLIFITDVSRLLRTLI